MNETTQTLVAALDRARRVALTVGLGGLALCLVALFVDPTRTIQSYLVAFLFWMGIGLGCLGMLMIQYIVRGAWGLPIRRLLEAGALTIPLMAALFVPVLLGERGLYPWVTTPAPQPNYLNVPFFIVRAILYLALWTGLASALRRWSRQADTDSSLLPRLRNLSIFGAVALALTGTFAMIDWIMSLEPTWTSTIYAAMVLAGALLAAFALVITLATRLEPLRTAATPAILNDLGNLLLAELLMWAYLAFSQYLIIWTGNLSDEIPWYLRRLAGGWLVVAVILVALHLVVPFLLLLSPRVKRSGRSLGLVAAWLVLMHLLETFWLVLPAFHPNVFSLADLAAPIGIGGLWVAVFLWQLRQSPLLAEPHPALAEQGTPLSASREGSQVPSDSGGALR